MVWSRVEQLLFTEPCSLVVVGSSQGFTKIGYSLGILHVEADLNQGTAGMGFFVVCMYGEMCGVL